MGRRCEFCGRGAKTTRHHLVPRSEKKRAKDRFGPVADLCRDCHRMIHATFENKSLAREFWTLDNLRAAPELRDYLAWIRRRPGATYFGSRDRRR
jgi:hypothetical protein